MNTRSISGEHNFDLSSPSLDEDGGVGEVRHDTEKMSKEDILAALKKMEEDAQADEEKALAEEDKRSESGVHLCGDRHDTLRPPPDEAVGFTS